MWKSKCTHEENRIKVCVACGIKISFGTLKPKYFEVSEKQVSQIRNFLDSHYVKDDDRYPLGICNTCRKTLSEHDVAKKKVY